MEYREIAWWQQYEDICQSDQQVNISLRNNNGELERQEGKREGKGEEGRMWMQVEKRGEEEREAYKYKYIAANMHGASRGRMSNANI